MPRWGPTPPLPSGCEPYPDTLPALLPLQPCSANIVDRSPITLPLILYRLWEDAAADATFFFCPAEYRFANSTWACSL